MVLIDKINPSARYSIKEVAMLTGVSVRTIYYHSDAGKIKYNLRKSNNRREYNGAEIIKYLRII